MITLIIRDCSKTDHKDCDFAADDDMISILLTFGLLSFTLRSINNYTVRIAPSEPPGDVIKLLLFCLSCCKTNIDL